MTNTEQSEHFTVFGLLPEDKLSVDSQDWLGITEKEYLSDFIAKGGSAVKFVEGEDDELARLQGRLSELAQKRGLTTCRIDAAQTKIHMIQDIFFAISRSLDWPGMAQVFLQRLVHKNGYEWPRASGGVTLQDLAACNNVNVILFRRELIHWMTEDIMRDRLMNQDFRIAMTTLCQTRLEPNKADAAVTAPVLEWLRGELRAVGALRQTYITTKITRHNGRAALRSLCRWLQLCGLKGLFVTIDIRQILHARGAPGEAVRYSGAAVLDAFEVLRQLIDDAESFQSLFVVVLGDRSLTEGDPKRSLHAYDALKGRVWSDVRATGRDNPLAALVRITSGAQSTADSSNG